MLSIDGLVSGLNTESIINSLISLQNKRIEPFNQRKAQIQVKQQSLQGVEARLHSFRTKLSQLNRPGSNLFSSHQVTSSHEDILKATANDQAIEGSYTLRVNSLATAHQIGSNGLTGASQEITTGTISFQVGERPPTEITIDETNNSVAGLVQAINAQSSDVSAIIVNDPSSGTSRIVLTAKRTGESNTINVLNNLQEVDGIARPDFSGAAIQEARDAEIQFGSGPGAIISKFQSNVVDGLIDGVTLHLASANPGQEVRVTTTRDTKPAEQAIKEFVDEFNNLMSFINEQSKFDTATQTANPLLGNRNVSDLKNQLLSMVTEAVPGMSGGLNRLSQIGIAIDGTGKLNLDSAKLNQALSGDLTGIVPSDIERLFGMSGVSSHSGIEFFSGSSRTQASQTPIQVDILQAAEQATLSAASALAGGPIVIDSSNHQFRVTLDGLQSEELSLTAGSYTQAELAAHLQSVINASATLGSREVSVTVEGGHLQVTSHSYGSASTVSGFTGSAIEILGFSGEEQGVGKDVAGSFIVNGVVEQAVGTGRLLIGNSNNPHTADLQVRVTLSPHQVGDGPEGSLTVTHGATFRVDALLNAFLDSEGGTMSTLNNEFKQQIESMDKSIQRIQDITESKRQYLVKQFATLERTLSSLQATASIVSSQLAQIQ